MEKKYLFGIAVYRREFFTSNRQVRIFGIPVFSTNVDFRYPLERIKMFGVTILKRDVTNRFIRHFCHELKHRWPDHDLYIVFSAGCGEIFLLSQNLENLIFKFNSRKPLVVVHDEKLVSIIRASVPSIPIVVSGNFTGIYLDELTRIKESIVYNPLNFKYYKAIENKVKFGRCHYYHVLKETFNLPFEQKIRREAFRSQFSERLCNESLNKNYVFISPEAETIDEVDVDFWRNVAAFYLSNGFCVYVNSRSPKYVIDGCLTIENLSFSDALYIAAGASLIVGIRSGFVEIALELSPVPAVVIYNRFKRSANIIEISAHNAKKGFGLSELPIRSVDDVFELEFSSQTLTEVQKISAKILPRKSF